MRKTGKRLVLIPLAAAVCLLSGCGRVDETLLDGNADFSVDIALPYATNTPLPEYLNVPDQVVIDLNGGVTVNDASLLSGSTNADQLDESGYTTLSLGDSSPAVSQLQERLKQLGYFSGDVSGVFDNATEVAVKRFEQTYGVMQTGNATPAFQARLYAEDAPAYLSDAYDTAVVSQYSTLQRGAVGSSVYALQHRLKELGYPVRELSGVYDEETEQAVSLFSQAYGLRPQTIAYIALQKELYADTAIPYTPNATQAPQQMSASLATLSLGNVGTQVMRVQSRLIDLGYMTGSATGVFDAETEQAVRQFEATCGRTPTGTLDAGLQNLLMTDNAPAAGESLTDTQALYPDLTLGSEGEAVSALQQRLIELGYANGEPTGLYGEETAGALAIFQRYNGLEETGIATSRVQVALYDAEAVPYWAAQGGATPASTEAPVATPAPEETPEVPADTQTVALKRNDAGDPVTRLQERLIELGYDCTASGVYDEATARAVTAFQAAVGVPQTGEASVTMQRYLMTRAAPASKYRMFNSTQSFETLQLGDMGEGVAALQWQLWTLGYMTTEDVEASLSVFDEKTQAAVISAQYQMGYEAPDGIAGPEFQCFVFSDYNKFIKK